MFQVKIIYSDNGYDELQNKVNDWLVNVGYEYEIVDIKYQDNNRQCSALIIFRNGK